MIYKGAILHPIADLHCDLLSYLIKDAQRTAYDLNVRCSIPQLRLGHVKLQTLAVFAETGPHSVQQGLAQVSLYKNLPLLYPEEFAHPQKQQSKFGESDKMVILMALEGASTFCDEQESIQDGLKRLRLIIQEVAKPVYMSLTWNRENRFGGGVLTDVGLKEDGKRLLDELHQQGIAVDLSHASDALASDIFQYVDHYCLNIPIIASHSNSRVVMPIPRNLPDEIAQEIWHRGGIIGLNFYSLFVGLCVEDFIRQLTHWLELGGAKHVCFGADFFYEKDIPPTYQFLGKERFFPDYQDASCYSRLLDLYRRELHLNEEMLKDLAYQNLLSFLTRLKDQHADTLTSSCIYTHSS